MLYEGTVCMKVMYVGLCKYILYISSKYSWLGFWCMCVYVCVCCIVLYCMRLSCESSLWVVGNVLLVESVVRNTVPLCCLPT